MSTRRVKLTVINDFVCVNCCIGHHELLNAITHCKEDLKLPLSFELEHVPFRLISDACLNETSPKIERSTFYANHYGKEKFENLQKAITKWGEEKGIPISFRGVVSQTTRAHRLCQKAHKIGGQELQLAVLCAVFKTHMEDGNDISDNEVLADVAESTHMMSRAEAIKFLESDELEKEVNEMCESARAGGVKGVPMIIIDGKWAVSGGQSSEVFVQIFQKLAAAGVHSAPSPSFSGHIMEATELCA